ncbi:MAG TPA: bifunctional diguanylate cyclase/phosphodiesterase [Bacillus bacterium]|uniref:Bifunctional diguanylate cyclase/phosphodiesterase n=1 Tax=Siminovitchia fordii TaxID=254759 RepID=A0ABQ4K6Z7_9BACI|nr:EAL domain-containing protein [Siminovitchia fordii]GIN20955.1 bifunctional diguanylate cyclase/phosphodiesterase [Siminovitchia fordii]HBZ09347.1 bifunctional diguanylate cyclase/phosphodiesterase [Bacillus sp. (in: firmicutes)]
MEKIPFFYSSSSVLISILILIFACVTALDLLRKVHKAETQKKKNLWLAASASMMGIGIWSTHLTAMLSLETSTEAIYNGPATFFSLIAVTILTYASFYVFTLKDETTVSNLLPASVLLGAGILVMHYSGAYGTLANSYIKYNYFLVAMSIFSAVGIPFIAGFLFTKTIKESFSLFHIPVAVILSLGVSITHYIVMKSMTLYEVALLKSKTWVFSIGSSSVLIGIAIFNFTIMGLIHTLSLRERNNHEEKMNYMAYYDQLTGLPNRMKFQSTLREAVLRNNKSNHQLAVMFIDLDRFRLVNDTLGHQYGDSFLIKVGERLVENVPSDMLIARHGGDEFVILLENTDKLKVKKVAEQILNLFMKPFVINEKEFFTTTSIGISLYPDDGHDVGTLMKHAYKAMHLAQKNGYNNYQFFVHQVDTVQDRKIRIEQGLKKALHHNEFELYYQPQVHLESGRIVGVEALLRWKHPELGNVFPYEFIPIAESTGMIIPIGKWVIQEACKQIRRWQSEGIRVKIAVNVSALQFEDHQFIELINESLSKNLLPPKYLELEITESVMQKINQSYTIIGKLKNIGIKVSIDDFGTGYSSLSVLSSLPIDAIKIDKSFVRKMMTDSNTASVVKTIIEMGSNLSFNLIAEGIETEEQREFLLENGCHLGQGYLYSPPVTKGEIEKLLIRENVV